MFINDLICNMGYVYFSAVIGSMSVDSQLSHVLISKLSVGSRYEISVRSVIGAIESDATTASVVTGIQ